MKTLVIALLIGLCAAAQAEIVIYSNTFDGVDASPIVFGGGNSADGFRVVITNAAGAIQSIQGNGSAATVINSSGNTAGLFPTAGVNNFPSVGSTNAFHMRADFVLNTLVSGSGEQMGYGLFSKTTWTAANGGYARMQFGIDASAGGGFLQPINIAKTGVGTGNDAVAITFNSSEIGAWSASDTYRLTTDFTFNTTKGQVGVAGSSGTNYWSVRLTLKNLNTGKEVTRTTSSPE
ncbi:MAG: hypothetical protein NTV22_02680, partial [bacterium]|nr:hypothetical protein [bacterium]